MEIGALNGIFVLGRSMGFIGEFCSDRAVTLTFEILKRKRLNSCLSHVFRTLPGPEEAETGFVPPPLG